MHSKCGVTGFHDQKETHELPVVKFEEFKKNITAVLSALGYKPLYLSEAGVTPSFHFGTFENNGERIFLVCNTVYPLIAVASEIDELECELQFIDLPAVADAVEQYTEFTVLSMEYLGAFLSKDKLANLNEMELSQIKYWQPAVIGDVIFNWWD